MNVRNNNNYYIKCFRSRFGVIDVTVVGGGDIVWTGLGRGIQVGAIDDETGAVVVVACASVAYAVAASAVDAAAVVVVAAVVVANGGLSAAGGNLPNRYF